MSYVYLMDFSWWHWKPTVTHQTAIWYFPLPHHSAELSRINGNGGYEVAFAVCMKDPVLKPLDITVVYLDYLFLIDNVYCLNLNSISRLT